MISIGAPARVRADPPAPGDAESTLTTYTFEQELVTGKNVQPLGEVLTVRKRSERTSLVRPREHYVRELLKSVEAL